MAGHINAESLLTEVGNYTEMKETCVHGTFFRRWASIQQEGLKTMGRMHVHFAPDEKGLRAGCEILIFLDAKLAMEKGMKFFRSSNNVLLSPGFDGVIPLFFFQKVVQRWTREPVWIPTRDVQSDVQQETSLPGYEAGKREQAHKSHLDRGEARSEHRQDEQVVQNSWCVRGSEEPRNRFLARCAGQGAARPPGGEDQDTARSADLEEEHCRLPLGLWRTSANEECLSNCKRCYWSNGMVEPATMRGSQPRQPAQPVARTVPAAESERGDGDTPVQTAPPMQGAERPP